MSSITVPKEFHIAELLKIKVRKLYYSLYKIHIVELLEIKVQKLYFTILTVPIMKNSAMINKKKGYDITAIIFESGIVDVFIEIE